MNLAEMLLDNPELVKSVAGSLGLGQSDTRSGMEALLPGLARGLQRNARQPGGLESLLDALKGGGHSRYVDDPRVLGQPSTRDDGNAILGHVLGSKDVSRNMAGHAARRTGLDSSLLKKMLPLLAAAAMGALSKQATGGGSLSGLSPNEPRSQGGGGLLEAFLDSDRDGSVIDDVLNLASKFL